MEFKSSSIVYSEKENWDEFIQIAFVGDNNEYIALSSIIYEEEVAIEFFDQTRYVKLLKKDLRYSVESSKIVFTLEDIIKSSSDVDFRSFEILLNEDFDKDYFDSAFDALITFVEEE